MFLVAQHSSGRVYVRATGLQHHLEISGTGAEVSDDEQVFPGLEFKPVAAVLGVLVMKLNTYVVLASSAAEVGAINGSVVHKVTLVSLLNVTGIREDEDEARYVQLAVEHLELATLYFLDGGYNLAVRAQSQGEAELPFVWNGYMLAGLGEHAHLFGTPVIYGYVKTVRAVVAGTAVEVTLVTRRSVLNAGTRYLKRGVDADGNVANFNETEQLLAVGGTLYLYLQIRGSVPAFWCEVNNIKYRPQLYVAGGLQEAADRHLGQLAARYGTTYLVNLVNQSGYEQPVKRVFEEVVAATPANVKYIYFDFHHECRKMRWDRVRLLLTELQQLGYSPQDFFKAEGGAAVQGQRAVVRSNCMDCLDRTNVVQSTLAHWVLQHQLADAGVVAKEALWEAASPELNRLMQNMWADNADAVSLAYSGTGALKTDFTRTGKRTRAGALKDLQNLIARYYGNNLVDGARQDGYDLVLGRFRPYGAPLPFADQRPAAVRVAPYVALYSLVVAVVAWAYPRGGVVFGRANLVWLVGGWVLAVLATGYIWTHGRQFVRWPRLVRVGFLEERESAVLGTKGREYVLGGRWGGDLHKRD